MAGPFREEFSEFEDTNRRSVNPQRIGERRARQRGGTGDTIPLQRGAALAVRTDSGGRGTRPGR